MAIESPRRRYSRERSPFGSVVAGVLIAAFGLSLLANNLGWGDLRYWLHQVWPGVLVILGIVMVVRRKEGREGRGFWGVVFILGGVWAFASQNGWVQVRFWSVFGPTLLILLGASFVWRAIQQHQNQQDPSGQPPRIDAPLLGTAPRPDEPFIRAFAVMSGQELKPTSTPFAGADLGAVMGGVVLDLNGAQMDGDTATIEVFAMLGGIEIFVPRDWQVITKVTSFMGACVDKRRPAATQSGKTLVVRGFAMLGGIDIKD